MIDTIVALFVGIIIGFTLAAIMSANDSYDEWDMEMERVHDLRVCDHCRYYLRPDKSRTIGECSRDDSYAYPEDTCSCWLPKE